MTEYAQMFTKTFDFKGRSSPRDFWIAQLFSFLFCILFCFLALPFAKDFQIFAKAVFALEGLYNVMLFLPSISLLCRRLRDAGFSPFVAVLALLPAVGWIILLCLCCMPSKQSFEQLYKTDSPKYDFANSEQSEDLQITFEQIAQNPAKVQEHSDNQSVEMSKVDTAHVEAKPETETKTVVAVFDKPKQMPKSSQSVKKTKDAQVSRSQKIKLLQQKRDLGEISIFEYQQEILKILRK